MRCINFLNRPTEGTVTVDGKCLNTMTNAELRAARRQIAMIFQHFNILSSRTVYDNAAFPLELAGWDKTEIRKKVEPLLDLVGLADHRNKYPSQLSGGQKQRVGIARALASDPKVLLSDEATSALDPETTVATLQLLKQINRDLGLTIVMITHQMDVVKEICDRVAVMWLKKVPSLTSFAVRRAKRRAPWSVTSWARKLRPRWSRESERRSKPSPTASPTTF